MTASRLSVETLTMSEHVYKSVELTGSSKTSSDDAIRCAIERASKTIRDIRWFQVIETRGHVEDGKVAHWQVTLKVGFTLQ
jgi:flavin-binding protein dodecin